jgi:O-antigen ligase
MAAAPRSTVTSAPGTLLDARPAAILLALLYALTLVGFPLVSTLPTLLGVGSQVVSVPFRMLVLGLAGAIGYLWLLNRTRLCGGAAVYLALLFWLLLLGRVFMDTVFDPLPGEPGMPVSQYLQLSIGACFLPALAFLQIPTVATLDLARRLTEVLGAIAMVALLYLGLRGFFDGSIFRRLSTEVLNPISVGHLGVTVFVATLAGLSTSTGIMRVLRYALVALSLVVVVASVSRGPILAAMVVALLYVFAGQLRNGLSLAALFARIALIVGAIGIFAFAIYYLESNANVQVIARFAEVFADASSQERLLLFSGAWQQFAEQPVLGQAYVELRLMTYPHNLVIETLMATGVVGLTLLLLILLGGTIAGARVLAEPPQVAWPALLVVQYLVLLLFSGSILLESRLWAMLFAVFAIDAGLRAGREPAETTSVSLAPEPAVARGRAG